MSVVLMLVILGAFYWLGHFRGTDQEKRRHARAVKEAQTNITSLDKYREGR